MPHKNKRCTMFLVAACFSACFAGSALAERTEIDLNGSAPLEYLVVENGETSLHYWSESNDMWLEVFRGVGEIEVAPEESSGALAAFRNNGRLWSWVDNAYVPQIGQMASYSDVLDEDRYNAAVGATGLLETVPPTSPANQSLTVRVDGQDVEGVLLGSSVFCSMGGSFCPVVFFKDNSDPVVGYLNMAFDWGVADGGEDLILENLGYRELVVTNLATDQISEIVALPPRPSEASQIDLPHP